MKWRRRPRRGRPEGPREFHENFMRKCYPKNKIRNHRSSRTPPQFRIPKLLHLIIIAKPISEDVFFGNFEFKKKSVPSNWSKSVVIRQKKISNSSKKISNSSKNCSNSSKKISNSSKNVVTRQKNIVIRQKKV